MSGSLGDWSIEDLLQIARITHKTTCIEVKGPQGSGAIHLRDGAVVDAVVDGVPPVGGSRFSQVVEAIEALAALEDGSFEFVARPAPQRVDRPIEVPAITAAMEKDGVREKRLTDLGITPGEGLAVGRHIDDALNIKPAVWQLLADLVEPFSIELLQRRMGRRKAVATLLTLDALGVLARHDGPVEAAERLALTDAGGVEYTADDGEVSEEFQPDSVMFDAPEATETGQVDAADAADAADEPQSDAEADRGADDASVSAETGPNPWLVLAPRTSDSEPIVEIFGVDESDTTAFDEMHEVVTPSETTLVSDVLGDMRSRFRQREYLYEEDDED